MEYYWSSTLIVSTLVFSSKQPHLDWKYCTNTSTRHHLITNTIISNKSDKHSECLWILEPHLILIDRTHKNNHLTVAVDILYYLFITAIKLFIVKHSFWYKRQIIPKKSIILLLLHNIVMCIVLRFEPSPSVRRLINVHYYYYTITVLVL